MLRREKNACTVDLMIAFGTLWSELFFLWMIHEITSVHSISLHTVILFLPVFTVVSLFVAVPSPMWQFSYLPFWTCGCSHSYDGTVYLAFLIDKRVPLSSPLGVSGAAAKLVDCLEFFLPDDLFQVWRFC